MKNGRSNEKARRVRRRSSILELPFVSRGGPREGAGRKPDGDKAGVPHKTRALVASRYPVHVTTRIGKGLPSLRRNAVRRVLHRAFERAQKEGFRLVHFSIQSNHLHLIVEARDRVRLARGVQGLLIRTAKALNRLWGRKGKVFSDRYHDHILKTPREVRHALAYVLQNARRHRVRLYRELDAFSSGAWFDGWRRKPKDSEYLSQERRPTAQAHTWLLKKGWRRAGLLDPKEVPKAAT